MRKLAEPNGTIKAERYVTIAAILFGMVGSLWGFAVKPIEGRLKAVEDSSDKRAARIEDNQHELVSMREKLEEIETQFRMLSVMNNIHFAEGHKFTQLLWKKVYGDGLPDLTYFPEVGR